MVDVIEVRGHFAAQPAHLLSDDVLDVRARNVPVEVSEDGSEYRTSQRLVGHGAMLLLP
jgi:hypothetical protein